MDWTGRQLFDVNGASIGVIAGAGYERRKFGTSWIVVEMEGPRRMLLPGDDIRESGDRLVFPYPRGYVETGPALEGDAPLDRDGERRLRLHYGIGGENGGQCKGCGLCIGTRRVQRRKMAENA